MAEINLNYMREVLSVYVLVTDVRGSVPVRIPQRAIRCRAGNIVTDYRVIDKRSDGAARKKGKKKLKKKTCKKNQEAHRTSLFFCELKEEMATIRPVALRDRE